MKIFFCHGFSENRNDDLFMRVWIESWLNRLQSPSIEIKSFVTGLNYPGRRIPWSELDRRWKRGDKELMNLYQEVAIQSEGFDVMINFGGMNLHPEFIQNLPIITVWYFFDDPEASNDFSKYMAVGHDLCAVANIAELDTYKSWGAKNVFWAPAGFRHDDYDPNKTREVLFSQKRDIDITLLCERLTHYRRAKVDKFARTFPQGIYRGKGWAMGFLPENERVPILQRTKIGINIHNSTGPINHRTFSLPANGILQICDNKSHLGKIFKLKEEVVGYDTIEEAIELTRYYLFHSDKQIEIAMKGYEKTIKNYNEQACFKIIIDEVNNYKRNHIQSSKIDNTKVHNFIDIHILNSKKSKMYYKISYPIHKGLYILKRLKNGIYFRFLRLKDNLKTYISEKNI